MTLFLQGMGRWTVWLGLIGASSLLLRAEGTNLPASLAPGTASSSFLEGHPGPKPPSPADQPGLTLQPGADAAKGETDATTEMFPISPAGQAEDLAAHLLVVYNREDPESAPLAAYYATRRDIPLDHVLAISCPVTEEITRAQYEENIRGPITGYLVQKGWIARQNAQVTLGERTLQLLAATRNDIWAMVLIRGVPLKIAPDPSEDDSMEREPELQTNAAAVDSELALLPAFGFPKGGYVPNLFFDGKMSGLQRVGPQLARTLILVTRLDGPKPSDVRRMIDDSLAAEKGRLAGLAVVDSRGIMDVKSAYVLGDLWMRNSRKLLAGDGWTVKFDDKAEVLPATDTSNDVAFYLGWYSGEATGPWVTSPNRFVPGAIAYHLHSLSAATVRSESHGWVGPLIAHGAAATMGTVYEPYLALTPQLDIFTRRLLQGNYFAEAAYASERGLSWMTTVVGDPLYRPFRVPLDSAVAQAGDPRTAHDDWLLLQQVQRKLLSGEIPAKPEAVAAALDLPGVTSVASENLGDLLEKFNTPETSASVELAYQKALEGETLPLDRIRVGLKLAQHEVNHGEEAHAQAELEALRNLDPLEAKRFGVADLLVPTSVPVAAPEPSRPAEESPVPTPALPVASAPKPTPPSLPLPEQSTRRQ